MSPDAPPYLRLSQFLDLESRWIDAGDKGELCHRICQTIVLLLDTPAAALGMVDGAGRYAVIASEGSWEEVPAAASAVTNTLVRKARETGLAQIKSVGDSSVGIFPFRADPATIGCLHVRIERPIFQGAEVSFLRFLASLTGIVLAGGVVPTGDTAVRDAQPDHAASEDRSRRYVAMAVHDLRNPLNVVAGYASMLADGTLGELSPSQRNAVEAIDRQVGVLLSVVDQLIDLDRLGGAERPERIETFELRAMFDEMSATRFAHAIQRIRWPGPESAFEFSTDRQRLFSIVQNLVDNALRHGGEGTVTVECTRRNAELLVEVSDRGPGLDPAVRAALQSDPAADGLLARNGLGLYSVVSYVAALGGKVTARGRDEGGTTISIRIPRAQPLTTT